MSYTTTGYTHIERCHSKSSRIYHNLVHQLFYAETITATQPYYLQRPAVTVIFSKLVESTCCEFPCSGFDLIPTYNDRGVLVEFTNSFDRTLPMNMLLVYNRTGDIFNHSGLMYTNCKYNFERRCIVFHNSSKFIPLPIVCYSQPSVCIPLPYFYLHYVKFLNRLSMTLPSLQYDQLEGNVQASQLYNNDEVIRATYTTNYAIWEVVWYKRAHRCVVRYSVINDNQTTTTQAIQDVE